MPTNTSANLAASGGFKSIFASKGVWGGFIAIAAVVANFFGFGISDEIQTSVVDWVVSAGGLVGGALAIWGRIRANKAIAPAPL